MKNICLRLCGISMALMSLGAGIAHASPATVPASDVTQTHATLSGTGATGFQVKYGTLVELDEIAQNALAPDSDPVSLTLDRYQWKKRNGWVESYYNTSSPLPVNTPSTIATEVTLTAQTTVTFDWGVDSEEGIGILSFIVDGQTLGSISGLVDFTPASFTLAPGKHTIKWEYRKTAVTNVGMDLAKLRNIDLRNTTPGKWVSMDAQGGSVTVDDLYPGQDYIFRAVDASGNYSGLKQFRTLDITIGDMTIDPITQTTATVSAPLDYGDAQVETGVLYTNGSITDNAFSYALLAPDSRCNKIEVKVNGSWFTSYNCLVFLSRFDGKYVTASFEMLTAGEISFDASVTGGRLDFYIDGASSGRVSGSKRRYTYSLSAGRHTLQWKTYYNYSDNDYRAEIGNLSIPYVTPNINESQAVAITTTDINNIKINGLTPNTTYGVKPYVNLTYQSRFENRWNNDNIPYKGFNTLPVTADTLSVADLRQASVTLRGKVVGGDAEIAARGLQYKDATGKRWTDFPAAANSGEEISAKVTRLRPSTKYDYRAYIQAAGCDTVFSVTGSFTTEAVQALVPVLLSRTQHTAKIQGEIVAGDAQIYQRGMQFAPFSSEEWEDFEDDGADDKFILERTGLDYNGAYKARTYVQPAGCDIIYSKTLKFYTKPIEVKVDSICNIMQRTATFYGHTDGGDHGIDQRYYSISLEERIDNIWDSFRFASFNDAIIPFQYEVIQNDFICDKGKLLTKEDATLKIRLQTFETGHFYFYYAGTGSIDFYINNELISTLASQQEEIPNPSIYDPGKKYQTSDIYFPGTYELEWHASNVNEISLCRINIESGKLPIETSSDDFIINLSGLYPDAKYSVSIYAKKNEDESYSSGHKSFTTASYFTDPLATNLTQSKATLQAFVLPTNDTPEEMGFTYTDDAKNTSKAVGTVNEGYLTADISNLTVNSHYRFWPYAKVDGYVYEWYNESEFTTPPVDMKVAFSDITQTKAKMTITCDKGDATVSNIEYSIDYGDYTAYSSTVAFSSLTPSRDYYVNVRATVNGQTYSFGNYKFRTRPIAVSSTVTEAAQTAVNIKVTPAIGDATFVASGIEYSKDMSYNNRIECDGDNMVLVNELDPGTTYYYRAWVETAEGATAVKDGTFKTAVIACQTTAADNISNRSARLNGTIDCDAYSSAEFGFEWKRMTGWESDPAFTKGVRNSDGTISVTLVNGMLDPDTDYQFRTAVRYKGKMYASGWKNFRTENEFILYPGTVYTMYRTDRENNAIVFCGYYVAGSESVTAQGYEYWRNGGASAPALNAPATVETVYTGEDMQYTLPASMLADGNYSVRAFIETASGKTYGQALAFGVENGGISSVADVISPDIECRTVNGQIVVHNATGLSVRICDTMGRTIFHRENLGETEYFGTVHNTIYLLRFSNGMTFKIKP